MTSSQHRAASPPPSAQCQAWFDFDGTLSRQDVLDELISRFAVDQSWREIERRWHRGEIGSRQCLSEQIDLVRITPHDLDALLDGIALDPGALTLIGLLESRRVPVVVVSDSVDFFIRRVLGRHGLGHLPIRANAAAVGGGRLKFSTPHASSTCTFAAAHCKCATMDELGQRGRRSLYVGDGRSDLCASRKADFVFAKGVLADCLTAESIPFVRYSTLQDVAAFLSDAWKFAERPAAIRGAGEAPYADRQMESA
jgi:2-hydroxy-3-keto-5-methylthiopentenyl-1-phosphate phosphatase